MASSSAASPPGASLFTSAALFNKTSPPQQTFSLPKPLGVDVNPGGKIMSAHHFGLSPIGERRPADQNAPSLLAKLEPSASNPEADALPAILMRKLPRNTSLDVLHTMLLFAKDSLVDVVYVDSESPEDAGYQSAIARFMSLSGANEAKDKLDGKTISSDAKLQVELLPNAMGYPIGRRNTVDGTNLRQTPSSASSASSAGIPVKSSRFNGTFQSLEGRSPPNGSLGSDTLLASESKASIQRLFSPHSPLTNTTVTSKGIINHDPDDETGIILQDPVGFAARNSVSVPASRRPTNPAELATRFDRLSMLETPTPHGALASPPNSVFMSPRSGHSLQSPSSSFSPTGAPHSAVSPPSSGSMSPYHLRHPPPNPADQNPPCNTLYVGNLPVDTSEDELKAVFSKQRGYKRLCFRTKQNGPMCFVEFEDVSFATKALHELYGHPLHNSVKGGIRLSFSKNPLGVRSGQSGGNGLQAPSGPPPPPGMGPSMNGTAGAPPGFATATGPPPGLPVPHGPASHSSPMSMNGHAGSGYGGYGNGSFGIPHVNYGRQPIPMHSVMSANGFQAMGNDFAYR